MTGSAASVSHVQQRQAATVQAILGTQSLEQAGLHQQQQVTGSSLLQQQGLPIQTSTASIPGAAAAASVTAAWPNQPYSTINSVPGIISVDGQGSRGPGGAYGGQAGNAMVSNASQMGQGVDVAAQLAANVFAFASMDIERNMSSATVLQTGHGSGSAQNQVDAKDRAKQERRLACVCACVCMCIFIKCYLVFVCLGYLLNSTSRVCLCLHVYIY